MKNIIYIFLIQSYIYSLPIDSNITSSIEVNITMSMEKNITNIFSKFKNLKIITTQSTKESLDNIKNSVTDFAIVRRDLLYLSFKGLDGFNFIDYYLISKIESFSYLYFIGKKNSNIRYTTDLRNRKISVGILGNLGNYFLKKILNKIENIQYKVHFYSYPINKSLEEIVSNNLDFIFAFSPTKIEDKIDKYFLKNIFLEKKFKNILLQNIGLRDEKQIKTQYYIISSNKITNIKLTPIIKFMKNNNLLKKEVNSAYGQINPLIEGILTEIKQLDKIEKDNKTIMLEKKIYKKS